VSREARPAPVLSSWSLRARLTVVATALLGIGIAAGAALLAATVSRTLQEAVDSGALQSAREVAALVESDVLPDPVPVGGEGTAAIQVVDAQGRVRAASAGTDHLVPVLRPAELAAVRAGERLVVDGDRLGLDGPLRVVGVSAGPPADPRTVIVAIDYGSAKSGVRLLVIGLAVGAPLLLAVVALATWEVAGRALAPVEELRRGAAEITGSGGSWRLLLPARDEVHRLAVTLNDMLARLDRAGARQRAFVSDAAHELRSPVASARTQLEVAARVDAGTPVAALAEDVLADVDRLERLVDDLLLLARLDEAPARRREPVDVGALAADVVSRYATARVPVALAVPAAAAVPARIGGDGTSGTTDRGGMPGPVDAGGPGAGAGPSPTGEGLVVAADPPGLRRVLVNLVDNAVRYARSRVEVELAPAPGGVTLSVTDDGPGIPAEDRERVFDRFTRVGADRGRGSGGAGLGLAIVRELVRAHGGAVRLEDADPGLRAVVELPRGQGDGRGRGTR
jgi:signal transduction histidine kinase